MTGQKDDSRLQGHWISPIQQDSSDAQRQKNRQILEEAQWFAFDLDDTLHEFRRASGAAINAVLTQIIQDLSPSTHLSVSDLKSEYAKVLAAKTSSAFVDGKTSHQYREERLQNTLAACSIAFSEEHMATWVQLYENKLTEALTLKPGVLDLFAALKSAGKKIAIITEGPQDAQERTIHHLGLSAYVDYLATTNKLGVAKTEGLFSKVVEALGVDEGGGMVMVGDSFARDVVPAMDVGIFCVHYVEREDSDLGTLPVRVSSFGELKGWVTGG